MTNSDLCTLSQRESLRNVVAEKINARNNTKKRKMFIDVKIEGDGQAPNSELGKRAQVSITVIGEEITCNVFPDPKNNEAR